MTNDQSVQYVLTYGDVGYLSSDAIPRASIDHAQKYATAEEAKAAIANFAKPRHFGKKWAAKLAIVATSA